MTTALLARVIGLLLLVIGVLRVANRQMILDFLERFFAQRVLSFWYGLIALPVAIGLLVTQSRWDSLLAATITLLSWVLLIEALIYMFLPKRYLTAIYRALQHQTVYYAVAASFIVVGCYLVLASFGALVQ